MDNKQKFYKEDWELYQQKAVEWKERYLNHLFEEYKQLLSQDADKEKTFYQLYNQFNSASKILSELNSSDESRLIDSLLELIWNGVIKMEDLKGFSSLASDSIQEVLDLYLYSA